MSDQQITVIVMLLLLFGLLVLMGLVIRGRREEKKILPQPKIGNWIRDALLWSPFPAFGNSQHSDRVSGQITAVHRNGTMTVRDWTSGDELTCLATGFMPADAADVELMRRLSTDPVIREAADAHAKLKEHWEKIRPRYETAPDDTRTDTEIREAFRRAEEDTGYDPKKVH